MKSLRILASVCAAALLVGLSGVTADASTGPPRLQQLAQAQTDLLLANYVNGNVASPATCSEGQGPRGFEGVFLLPTLNSAAGGNASFTCRIRTRSVLVDLFGFVVTEDSGGDSYFLADGTELLFTPKNLETICDDALPRFLKTAAPATVDGHPITGVEVSTRAFSARVNRAAGPVYDQSVTLGHPGRLATSYCGHKAVVRLSPGHHVIIVYLTDLVGTPTTFTYDVTVKN
jgi:hypothetical protein